MLLMLTVRELATLMLQQASNDWTAVAGILAIIIGSSTIAAALITGLLINPKIDSAKKEIIGAMVSREVFEIYTETDTREHDEIKRQIAAIPRNTRH